MVVQNHNIKLDLFGQMSLFLGAVWTRILGDEAKGYGYIDETTPELVIAIFKNYRHRKIGTRLVEHMIAILKQRGYKHVFVY